LDHQSTPIAIVIYNERIKLLASVVNLVAVGIIAIGVTTPLVSASYGTHLNLSVGLASAWLTVLAWLLAGAMGHILAQIALGRMIS
jgi:hypothetical protein